MKGAIIMTGRVRKICLLVTGLVICGIGIHIYFLRYYYYNKYNIHAQRAMMRYLVREYDQEFELISTEFKKKEHKTGGARYEYIWTFVLQDSSGRQFETYLKTYGTSGRAGDFYESDYSTSITDTYAQVLIEERLGDKYDLQRRRVSKVGLSTGIDYLFYCTEDNPIDGTKDNLLEIVEVLTEIYFIETEFNWEAYLTYSVHNLRPEGEDFKYDCEEVTKELQERGEEITYETVYNYFLQRLM